MTSMKSLHTFYKWCTTIGCFLLLFPLGHVFFWGNVHVYCTSYLTYYTGMAPEAEGPWIMSLKLGSTHIVGLFVGFLIRRTGPRPIILSGIALLSASYFLTYLSIQQSNILMVFTFGVLSGCSQGMMIFASFQLVADWAGDNVGTYVGIARSGRFIGGILTNIFVTLYVNPENKIPDRKVGSELYFSQKDLLDKVLWVFPILGTISTMLQIFGFFLVRNKPTEEAKKEEKKEEENRSKAENHGSCVQDVESCNKNTRVLDLPWKKSEIGSSSDQNSPSNTQYLLTSSNSISHSSLKPSPHLSARTIPYSSTSSSSTLSLSSSSSSPYSSESPSASPDTNNQLPTNHSHDLSPRQMITTTRFFPMSLTVITVQTNFIIVNNYYKDFGQLWIQDDFFLTRLGTCNSIAMLISSITAGVLLDHFNIKNIFMIYNIILTFVGSLYPFLPRLNTWGFSILTVLYTGMIEAFYSTFGAATAKQFGKAHFASNMGILYTPSGILGIILPLVLEEILLQFGWNYLFLFPVFCNVFAFVITIATDFTA